MANNEQLVLCFPRSCIAGCGRFTPWQTMDAELMIQSAEANMRWLPRCQAEISDDLIQPIPCALVLGERQKYNVFRRINQGRPDLRRRISLVIGGHIDWIAGDKDFSSLLMMTLMREIVEELGIAPLPSSSAKPIGLVADFSSLESSRHLGIVYEVTIAGQIKPRATEEFSTRSQYVGKLCTSRELSALHKEFDPWSTIIFGDYINPSYSFDVGQQLSLLSSR